MSIGEEADSAAVEKKVSELGPHVKGVDITVKVMSKTAAREVPSRIDGSVHRLAEALVGDPTGCIILTLWDDAIDKVNENETISIKNGYVSMFKGFMRLNTGKSGTIEPAEKPVTEVNEANNLSDRRFEQEQRYPKFRPLYGDMDRSRRGNRGKFRRRR
ncbi:hypothetical protein [Candidatus Hecatella orcuttiae]|jgi:replication factor A1|uniref:hypothetical protein n=1 Tax=Candidatus Hecatella orcuttiae TaxID=1935119 RepID=UPI0028680B9E|nr:hypothetical protein [Candidatus Hecatella orcuttiae]